MAGIVLRCYVENNHPAMPHGDWFGYTTSSPSLEWNACAWTHLIHQMYFQFENPGAPAYKGSGYSSIQRYNHPLPDNIEQILDAHIRALDYWEPE